MNRLLFFVLVMGSSILQTHAYSDLPELKSDTLTKSNMENLVRFDWNKTPIQIQIISQQDGGLAYIDQLNTLAERFSDYLIDYLQEGHYRLEKKDDLIYNTYEFFIINNEIWVPNKATIFQPLIEQDGRFIDVSMALSGPDYKISRLSKNIKTTVKSKDKIEIHQRLNLQGLMSGKYAIILSIGEKRLYKTIRI